MIFIEDDGGYAIITSLKHEDVNYKVYNPKSNGPPVNVSSCKRETYVKHQIKVLMFLCPNLSEGIIAHYSNSLIGTLNSGLNSMFSPCPTFTPYSQQTPKTTPIPQRTENPMKNICDLIFKLISNPTKNNMFM